MKSHTLSHLFLVFLAIGCFLLSHICVNWRFGVISQIFVYNPVNTFHAESNSTVKKIFWMIFYRYFLFSTAIHRFKSSKWVCKDALGPYYNLHHTNILYSLSSLQTELDKCFCFRAVTSPLNLYVSKFIQCLLSALACSPDSCTFQNRNYRSGPRSRTHALALCIVFKFRLV